MRTPEAASQHQPPEQTPGRITAEQRRLQIREDSIERQRESHDRTPDENRWAQKYVTRAENNAAYELTTRALRGTLGLRVAATLTRPDLLGIPRELVEKRKIPKEIYPLEGILVDPGNIPEGFAETIGLIDLSKFHGDPSGRLEHLGSLESIAKLKEFFCPLIPFASEQTRFYTVPENESLDPALTGIIIHFREDPTNDRNQPGLRKMILSHFTSGYAAYRKTLHERTNYGQEENTLTDIEIELTLLIGRLDKDWKTHKDQLIEETQKLLSKCYRCLENAQVPMKKEAHGLLQAAATLRDKRDRINVSAAMSKITAAKSRLESRFQTMRKTGSFNEDDYMNFRKSLLRQEKLFNRYLEHLSSAYTNLKRFEHFFDSSEEPDINLVRQLEKQLKIDPHGALPKITLRPFVTFKTLFSKAYSEFQDALANGSREVAFAAIESLQEVSRLYTINTTFERMKVLLAHSRPGVQHMTQLVSDAHQALQGREESMLYEDLFTSLDKTISLLTGALAEAQDDKISTDMAEEIGELLDRTPVEATLSDFMSSK